MTPNKYISASVSFSLLGCCPVHARARAGSRTEDGDASPPGAAGASRTLPDAVAVGKAPIFGGEPGNAGSPRRTGTGCDGAGGGGGNGLPDSGINAWV